MNFIKVKLLDPIKIMRTFKNVSLDSYGNLVDHNTRKVIYTDDEIERFEFDKLHLTKYTESTLKHDIYYSESFTIKCRDKINELNNYKFWTLEKEHYYEFYNFNDVEIEISKLFKK